ncbi:MAG: AAA family ATPase, partial [Candidatus Micrarchaeota archaeon]|nr:AAA family ATPase [Candidatus Micrarchaeota archaeon]
MYQIDLTPISQKFEEFFSEKYQKDIQILKNMYPEKRSFYFSYKELHKFDHEFAEKLIENPDVYLKAAQLALISMAGEEKKDFEPNVRIEEVDSGDQPLLIQDIGSDHIHKLISVTGVVTKRAEIRPRVKVAIYNCTNCGNKEKVVMEKGVYLPDACTNCRKRTLELDEKASRFMNIQRAEIQELLERVRSGSPASHIELFIDDDLCNTIIPGDTIEVVGIVRLRQVGKAKDPIYAKYIDVVSIRNTQREFEEVELSKEDIKRIEEFARQPNVFEIITNSIAPSIYGHKEMKQAVALQLFGGNPDKVLPEGGRIRSDIHILLIGDPGAAKTRLLQYVTSLAPKSIYVSGKSVSGVGLTASAEKDDLGEGWTLKAGALVLASGGLAAVDEFDKIDDAERAALHEVMESQSYHPSTRIMLANGEEKTIGEFVESLMERNKRYVYAGKDCLILDKNLDGIKVLTTDFKRIYPIQITQVSKHVAPKNFVKVTLSTGRSLIVTPEHPFWTVIDGNIATIPASRLKKGEFTLMPSIIRIYNPQNKYDLNFFRILGYHFGGLDLLSKDRNKENNCASELVKLEFNESCSSGSRESTCKLYHLNENILEKSNEIL